MEDSDEDIFESDEEISEEYEEEEEISDDWIREDLFNKNTDSFKCLAQIAISRSSLMRDPLYFFPELEDPDLYAALWEEEEPVTYDDIGVQRYKDLCKEESIIPYRRVIQSLSEDTLDLKYYALSEKAMKTICQTLRYNNYVKHLILQENWLKPEAAAYLAPLIQWNKCIKSLDLKQCQLGHLGAEQISVAINLTSTLTELDLSFNNLGDEGMQLLAESFRDNTSIQLLNLSHNNLGDRALTALKMILEDNYMIRELDLSWNYLYSPAGMKDLMVGLAENIRLTHLNLAWNGIGGDKETFKFILLYLKSDSSKLQHLDLSNNRITGITAKMLRTGLKYNESLITLDLSYNPLTANEVEFICGTFFDTRENPISLNYINFGNTFVNKSFLEVRRRIRKLGCGVDIGGIYSNYTIKGPNLKHVLLNRAKYVAMKPKKKKQRKDIGQFIIQLQDESIKEEDFLAMIKKQKIKLDQDLLSMMTKTFADKKKVDCKDMKENYLILYPDTVPPEPHKKKKKGKGRDKKKKKKAAK